MPTPDECKHKKSLEIAKKLKGLGCIAVRGNQIFIDDLEGETWTLTVDVVSSYGFMTDPSVERQLKVDLSQEVDEHGNHL